MFKICLFSDSYPFVKIQQTSDNFNFDESYSNLFKFQICLLEGRSDLFSVDSPFNENFGLTMFNIHSIAFNE